jgi:sirohydrochlorin ferrochelatase
LIAAPLAGQQRAGLLVVAHGADSGWNARVRQTLAQVRWPAGPVALAFLMGPEATSSGWDSALAQLERGGATSLTVVPLFVSSHGGHYRQVEYYAGVRDSWDGAGSSHDHAVRHPAMPVVVTPALDAAPEVGAALANAWAGLDSAVRRHPVIVIAHGPTSDAEAKRWVTNLSDAVVPALRRAGLRAEVRIGLLRDDAPPPDRARAIQAIRDTVTRLAAAGSDSVVVLTALISSGGIDRVKIPRDLEGLPVLYVPTPLAPRPELARWIERIAGERQGQPSSGSVEAP